MKKIEKIAIECASGKHGDAYDAAKSACLEFGEVFKEYLEKKKEEVAKKMKEHILYSQPEEFYHNRAMFCDEIINELFGEEKK